MLPVLPKEALAQQPLAVPIRRARNWAGRRVWLGQSNLATYEILPAFAGCEKSKPGRAVPIRSILIDRVSTLPFDS